MNQERSMNKSSSFNFVGGPRDGRIEHGPVPQKVALLVNGNRSSDMRHIYAYAGEDEDGQSVLQYSGITKVLARDAKETI